MRSLTKAYAMACLLICCSCSRRTPVAATVPGAPHAVDADAETKEDDADAPDSGYRIADPEERLRWFEARRITVAKLNEAHQMLGTPAPLAASTAVNPTQWTFIGPQPIVNATNPLAGSVLTLAIDPHNPSTVYAGTYVGRLWKTMDAGNTWQPLSDAGPLLDVKGIATDPATANTVYALNAGSIYKSSDGGSTWTEVPVTSAPAGCSTSAMAVHPAVSGTWLVSEYCPATPATSVIYKTTNSGSSWTKTTTVNGEIDVVGFNAGSPSIAYASGVTTAVGVIFETSLDAGSTWTSATGSASTALPQTLTGSTFSSVYAGFASSASDPQTIYLRLETTHAAVLLQLFKTTDGGKTWNLTNLPTEAPGARTPALTAVDPQNPSLVFCGAQKVYRSTDGGKTWADVRGDLGAGGLHGDNHAMIFTPDGSTLYTSNDGGVWSSNTFRSANIVWNNLNATLGNAEFSNQLGMDPSDANRAFGGLQDNFSIAYSGTPAWTIVHASGDGRGSAVNPQNVNDVYEMEGGDLFRSTTGGGAGTFSGPMVSVPNGKFVIDLKTPLNLYIASGSDFQQTLNGGTTWNEFGPPVAQNIGWVAVAPSDSNTVMAMDSSTPFITKNAQAGTAATWTTGLPIWDAVGESRPQQFVIDPANPAKVYAVSGDTAPAPAPLAVSADGGITWQARSLGPNVTDTPRRLVIDPDLPNVLYLGTDTAVFRSSDGGGTWNPLASGFPMSQVTDIELHRSARVLRVATIGRGAWDLAVPLTAPLPASASLAASNSGYTLTVTGTNFAVTSQIWLYGKAISTTYVSGSQLTATVAAAAITPSTVYNVSVNTPGNSGGLSNPVKVSTGPTIYPGGVLNAAGPVTVTNDLTGNPFDVRLSPGMFATIYGAGLAAAPAQATGVPYTSTLGGASVLINGVAAPLCYVSPGQIDFVVPWETPGGTATIQVKSNGTLSNTVMLAVEAAPQIFTTNQQGFGQAAVLVAGTAVVAAPTGTFPGSRPAAIGEYLSIYATGLGVVANPPSDGTPVSGITSTVAQPTVAIGCPASSGELTMCPVTPQFSGLAPGFVGLYQVNFQVPPNAASGNQVPLQLILPQGTGRPSNIVTIAVQ